MRMYVRVVQWLAARKLEIGESSSLHSFMRNNHLGNGTNPSLLPRPCYGLTQ